MIRFGRGTLWLAWSAVGVLATAGYFMIPRGQLGKDAAYAAIGLASAAMIVVGVRRHRPERPAMWYLFAVGTVVWVFGDITWSYYVYALGQEPYPSAADAFYLAAYPLLIIGLLSLVRRPRRRLGGVLDAGIVDAGIIATGLGLLLWTFVMRPIAEDATVDPLVRAIGLAYPAADVLMLALLVRMLTVRRARPASFWLLVAATVLLLGADIGFSLLTAHSTYQGGFIDAGWLLSYVAWGAAAAHPSMRKLSQPAPERSVRLTRRRLALLAVSSLLAPALLLFQGTTDPAGIDWLGIGACAVVLFLLVVVRVSGLTTQVQRQANELRTLAMRDDLTGLPNRRMLERRIRAAMAGSPAGSLQVAVIDLDDFKSVNDRLGHTVGDQLIAAVAQRLTGSLRPDDMVARLGGDEFAILLPRTADAAADELVDCVVRLLQRPVAASEHELLVQASIGISTGDGTTDPFEVLRRADVAMYAAKDAGGNQALRFHAEMDERASEYARLGARLRQALDEGQFELVYQPIVALPHGRLAAVEALLRWRHPRFGVINPLEFVPVAERNGLIVPIGDWVLRQAAAQAAAWRRELGPAAPARITVNVSARQLAEPDFPDVVAEVLAESGLPPGMLAIEVTETAVFNGGRPVEAVNAIHRLGVKIALDDFGTGHSSLGLLHHVPVDILKVDKSFVDDVAMAGRNAVIATALINVSRGLDIIAVAEGVETAGQAEQLYRLGYRFAQGFHFGRPMPPSAVLDDLSCRPDRAADRPDDTADRLNRAADRPAA